MFHYKRKKYFTEGKKNCIIKDRRVYHNDSLLKLTKKKNQTECPEWGGGGWKDSSHQKTGFKFLDQDKKKFGKRSVNSYRPVVLLWFSPLHLKEMQVFNNNSTTPDKSRIKHNLRPQAL